MGDLESAYDEAVEFELPEVQGLHPHYALTMAVKDIAPSFSYDWNKVLIKHTSADANSISFQGMIKEFRDLRRLNESQAAPRARHGAFAASFQGQNADGSPKVYKCICAEEHRYARCLYLIPEIRPSRWKPNPTIQKKVDDALAKIGPYDRRLASIRRA